MLFSALLKGKIERYHQEIWIKIQARFFRKVDNIYERTISKIKFKKELEMEMVKHYCDPPFLDRYLMWNYPRKTVMIKDIIPGEFKDFLINMIIFLENYYEIKIDNDRSNVKFGERGSSLFLVFLEGNAKDFISKNKELLRMSHLKQLFGECDFYYNYNNHEGEECWINF